MLMQPDSASPYTLHTCHGYTKVCFHAMACPCEILIDSTDHNQIQHVAYACWEEVNRIEETYSRYRTDNLIYTLNQGKTVTLSDEARMLFAYAQHCFTLSEGLFDITTGIYRKIWNFTEHKTIPTHTQINQCAKNVGFSKLHYTPPQLTVPQGMEIDFGGFAKEYAVDKAFDVGSTLLGTTALLINLGGDIRCGKRPNHQPWDIGIEGNTNKIIHLTEGAIATSGNTYRYTDTHGKRYTHIINPTTGWAICDAPNCVTVAAPTCLEAGFYTTVSILHADKCIDFLNATDVDYWVS